MSTGYYIVRGKGGTGASSYYFYVDLHGDWPTNMRKAYRFPKLAEARYVAEYLYSEPGYDGETRYEVIDKRTMHHWVVRRRHTG